MHFLWPTDAEIPKFQTLEGDATTDVLIIGGGIAGILCAWILKQRGIDHLLAEAKTIGSGITSGTTAVVTAQHDLLYGTLIDQMGLEKAKAYLDANLWAVEAFRKLAHTVPCDFESVPSVVYSRSDGAKMEREAEAVNRLGFPAQFVRDIPLPIAIAGGVRFPDQGQFHPLKLIAGLAAQLNICENTFVTAVRGHDAFTERGKITAKHIVIATHFPFINRSGLYFAKMYQQRSYVIALENAAKLTGTYVDEAESGMYFRSYRDLLLIGGGDHRTGKEDGGFQALRDFAKRHYPDARERFAWAAQDCMSLDGIPYIGRYGRHMDSLYVLTGFNEWGMTSSMAGGRILADALEGKLDAHAEVFAPERSMLRKQLFRNLGAALGDFIVPTPRRCSHMGCALQWNSAEHTWDCPCHGSRFTADGKLIDNPAMKDSSV